MAINQIRNQFFIGLLYKQQMDATILLFIIMVLTMEICKCMQKKEAREGFYYNHGRGPLPPTWPNNWYSYFTYHQPFRRGYYPLTINDARWYPRIYPTFYGTYPFRYNKWTRKYRY